MNDNSPLFFVSVIVPVYNGERTVERCVQTLLAQTYPKEKYEIIFVDNKSKDDTVKVLQPYVESREITLLSETKVLNAYGARNTGIRAAKGEILAFTDADCEAESNWLSELVAYFHDPTVGCVAGEILPSKPNNVFEKYGEEGFLSQKKGIGQTFPPVKGGNCAFRKQAIIRIGLFREDFPSGGDTELAWRMVKQISLKIEINLNAIVKHHNVSSLQVFTKQSMRYGTHVYLFTQLPSGLTQPSPSFYGALVATITYFLVFAKRFSLIIFHLVPSTVSHQDHDIYLMRPLLRILSEWTVWLGYRFALRNPNLLR